MPWVCPRIYTEFNETSEAHQQSKNIGILNAAAMPGFWAWRDNRFISRAFCPFFASMLDWFHDTHWYDTYCSGHHSYRRLVSLGFSCWEYPYFHCARHIVFLGYHPLGARFKALVDFPAIDYCFRHLSISATSPSTTLTPSTAKLAVCVRDTLVTLSSRRF